MWLWGSYGRDQINLITAGGATDNTTLEDFNAKFNWQIVPSNTVDVWYLRSDKLKFGRNAGLTRPQETSWNQTLPQNTWKVADSQIVGSSLFLTAQYNGLNGDFTLDPQGDPNRQTFIDEGGVWHNTYEFFAGPRPQRQVKADTSYFFNAGTVGNELKAGFGYLKSRRPVDLAVAGLADCRSTRVRDRPAAQTYGDLFDCGGPCATITRQSNLSIDNKYYSAYLQDAITFDRLTVNLGVRWDQQYGNNNPTTILGNPTPVRRGRHRADGRLSGRQQAVHVERLAAARRSDLRVRLEPDDGVQGELLALRRGPRNEHDGPDQSDQLGVLRVLRLERRQRRRARRARRGRRLRSVQPDHVAQRRPGQPGCRGLAELVRSGIPRAEDLGGRRQAWITSSCRRSRSERPTLTANSRDSSTAIRRASRARTTRSTGRSAARCRPRWEAARTRPRSTS